MSELPMKRFYFDKQHTFTCTYCNAKIEIDFNNDYLSYPLIGVWDTGYWYCEECGKDFEYEYKLEIMLNVKEK